MNLDYEESVEKVKNLAEKVRRKNASEENGMNDSEISCLIQNEDFSKQKLEKRYIQIAESPDLYKLLNLQEPIKLKLESDRNRILAFAYLINKEIEVLPLI